MTNYKSAFKYPYIVTEILSSQNEKITNQLFLIEGENKPLILQIIETLNEINIQDSTIPGYVTKIIIAHISNDNFYNCIYNYFNDLFNFLFKNIESDSIRDITYELINKGLHSNNQEKFIEIFNIFINKLKETNINHNIFQNEIWLIIALSRSNEIIYNKIDEILSIIISIFLEKDDNTMNDYPHEITSKDDCIRYTLLFPISQLFIYGNRLLSKR